MQTSLLEAAINEPNLLIARLTAPDGTPIPNSLILFRVAGTEVGSSLTDSEGYASISYTSSQPLPLDVEATFNIPGTSQSVRASATIAVREFASVPLLATLSLSAIAAVTILTFYWRRQRIAKITGEELQ